MSQDKLFIGLEAGGCGSNKWALSLDFGAMTCAWGYHSRWMGTYDRSIETNGVIEGVIVEADEAKARYLLRFEVPSLSLDEAKALHEETFCVHDEARRMRARARAEARQETVTVRFTLDAERPGIYSDECRPEGLFPESQGLWESGGIFLERAGGAFSAILKNEDVTKTLIEHREEYDGEVEVFHDVVYRYGHDRAPRPFGFYRQHIPLFDLEAPMRFDALAPTHREAARAKAPFRRMFLVNQALDLLERPPRYDDASLSAARAAFEHDTLAEENIAALRAMGVEVIHGVDATKLDLINGVDSSQLEADLQAQEDELEESLS